MIAFTEVLALIGSIEGTTLSLWIEQRWVRPERLEGEYWFDEADVARVRLIHELIEDLAVATDTIPIVLRLLDQLYEHRARLRRLADAVAEQPPEVRSAILARMGTHERP